MSEVFRKKILAGFQLTLFENKRNFSKKAVLHTTTLIHCRARKGLLDLLSTNQQNDAEMTFLAGATKSNLSNLK